MATTYTLISSNVLSSTTYSITFSSIPSTYTDLVLKGSARSNSSGTEGMDFSFNGAAGGTSYSYTALWTQDGSSAASNRISSYYAIEAEAGIPNTSNTSNTFNSFELYVPSYLASRNKPVGVSIVKENNSTGSILVQAEAGLWTNTAAITSIQIVATAGGFVSGSSFYLYGISNA